MLPIPGNGKKYRQGIYVPKNPQKYVGKGPIRFLSAYELLFFRFCDNNPNVQEWVSEGIIIPYISPLDNRTHKYYTDGAMVIKEGDKFVKYLIEIKPSKQVSAPVAGKKKKKTLLQENMTYIVNQAKWNAAQAYADRNGFKFQILTEKELGIK